MTSHNINKIVRNNFNLKPWILSKNTSEIVSTCIEKIYKQIPNNFKNDLQHIKVATTQPENKAPIRQLRSQERVRPAHVTVVKPKAATTGAGGEKLLNTVMTNSRRSAAANFVSSKKLLRSPNYKIYGSRRFGSSASSSSASIFRRFDERRRNRMQATAQLNSMMRSFGSYGSGKPFVLNHTVSRYQVPARNQHMETRLGSTQHALQVSSSIQRDLMMIDHALKDRIALGRTKLSRLTPDVKEADPKEASLRGWHHPPAPELFLTRLSERGIADAELQEQHRKLRIASKSKQFELMRHGLAPLATATAPAAAVGGKKSSRLSESYDRNLKEPSTRKAHQPTPKTPRDPEAPPPAPTRRFVSRKTLAAEQAHVDPVAPPAATATSVMAAAAAADPATRSHYSSRYNRSMYLNTKKY